MEKKNLKRASPSKNNQTTTTTTSNNNNLGNSNINDNSHNKKRQKKSIENEINNNNDTNNTQNNNEDENKVIRVYADGIYDLFHFGHARSLQQAKQLFKNTYLIVGVCNDEITHKLKGKTVMNSEERAESLKHCRWVDEVVENAPWIVTQEFIDEHKIDYVSHGEDLCLDKDGNDIYQFVKDQGKFKTIKRTDGISTSDIILRIVKDYDSYVMRNLSRGYTGKQMNVGLIKENSLKLEEKLNQIKSKVKLWSDQTESNITKFLQRFSNRLPKNWEMKLLQSPTLSTSSGSGSGSGSDSDIIDDNDDQDFEDDTDDGLSSPISSSPILNNNNKTTNNNNKKTSV